MDMDIMRKIISLLKRLSVAVILLVGMAAVVFGIFNIRAAWVCSLWPTVKGRIVDSTPAQTRKPDGSSIYVANVVYEYTVKDSTYYSSNISNFGYDLFYPSLSYFTGQISDIKPVLNKYPVDSEVTVYYNPKDNDVSVIDPSLKLPVFLPLIFGILLLLIDFHLVYILGILSTRKN